jgi:hypothetical protein
LFRVVQGVHTTLYISLQISSFEGKEEGGRGRGRGRGRGYIGGGMNTLNNPEQRAPSGKGTLADNKGVTDA